MPERILILGPCGAGKSTLAQRLGPMLGLPVVHLDKEYWLPGWTDPQPDEWDKRVAELVAEPEWIMDGNYGSSLGYRLNRAQLLINLDYPRRVFFPRIVKRLVMHRGKARPDAGEGCPERFDLEFWIYAWRYRKAVQPKRERLIEGSGLPVIRLKTPSQTERWLAAGAPLEADWS